MNTGQKNNPQQQKNPQQKQQQQKQQQQKQQQQKQESQQKYPRFLLVDFENIQKIGISKISGDIRITVFTGSLQKTVPIELVREAQPLGNRLVWRTIKGNGKNAVDFIIACEMGKIFYKTPEAECIILSKDKGFDALIKELVLQGKQCKRVETVEELKTDAKKKTGDGNASA